MKTLNLEEILRRHIDSLKDGSPTRNLLSSNEVFQNDLFDFFMNLMKDVCQETLRLAADNASVDKIRIGKFYAEYVFAVNRESILDTINEIE